MEWWEREKLLTEKDKEAIARAKVCDSGEICENWAETDIGRRELHRIAIRKYRDEQYKAGLY